MEVFIAYRDGVVKQIPCMIDGSMIYVKQKDAGDAFAFFDDDDRSCMVEESGKFLDSLPMSELSGNWYFQKGERV